MTQILPSTPPAASEKFASLANQSASRIFASHDPAGKKLGSEAGGSYALILAKGLQTVGLKRKYLETDRPNEGTRFVNMSVSQTGLRRTRS